jgi:hypothetical protein
VRVFPGLLRGGLLAYALQKRSAAILDRETQMKTVKNLSFVLALALGAIATGCASDSPDDGGEGGGGGGGGGGEGSDDAPRPMDPTGKYEMVSTFDIATNAPGKVGEVTNAFINMTDGAADPAEWIIEQIIAKTTNSTLKSILTQAKPFVAGYLNDRLLQIAPDFVDTVIQVGNDFGQMARNFGLNETLEVAGGNGAFTANVTALGVKFKVDTIESDILFADHSIANVSAANVTLGLDATGKLDIGEHKLPLSYGKVLRIGLDEMIIPAVNPTATDLPSLLAALVDCNAVGTAINNALVSQFGFGGGASTWAAACTAGLAYGATTIYAKIDAIDSSALEFGLTGVAKAVDANKDSKVDTIQTGKWTGTLSYSGTPAPLSAATFTGSRM